jgi:hypothetical protein
MSHGGKGSNPRPFSVSREEFSTNYDAIFGKQKKTNTEQHVSETITFDNSVYDNERLVSKFDRVQNASKS